MSANKNMKECTPLLDSSLSHDASNSRRRQQLVMLLHASLLLITSLGNSIFFVKMTNRMSNHIYFVNQFTSVLYVPVFFVVVWYLQLFTNNITKEMTSFPKYKFWVMGIWDGLSGILMMFGAVHTSGNMQNLLANAVIPITMWLSYIILHVRYHKHQYIGAGIIMAGILFVMLPTYFQDDQDSETSNNSAVGGSDNPFFNALFLVSVVPMALSSIYKEVAFESTDIEINYLQAWTSLAQMFVGFALIPFNTMDVLGNQSMSWNELITAVPRGWECLNGHDVVVTHCNPYLDQLSHLPPCDDCNGSWIPLTMYMIFNILFNFFTVSLVKYGGATTMFVVMTLRLPLTEAAFSIRFIQDPPESIGVTSIVSLILIIVGLIFYRYSPEEEQDESDAVIMPSMFGNPRIYNALRHERLIRVRGRNAKQIRSALYTSLGIIPSPLTQRTGRFLGSGRGSPLGIVSNMHRNTPSPSEQAIHPRSNDELSYLNTGNKLLSSV